MLRLLTSVVLPGCLVLGVTALAQETVPARLRGTIAAVSDQVLTITDKAGATQTISLKPGLAVVDIVPAKLADIKPNSFVGVTAMPGPDGALDAVEVHIFPEAMRGTGEGHRPWDLGANSTMTNGTVGSVTGTAGRTIAVKYGSEDKTIVVPETAAIVSFEPGTASDLVKGAHVFVLAQKAPDGALTASRVNVGKDGLVPPM